MNDENLVGGSAIPDDLADPRQLGHGRGGPARSVPWFPVVGLLLGILAAALARGVRPFAPPMLAAAGIIVLLLSFSGCLHLDGLADTADGF